MVGNRSKCVKNEGCRKSRILSVLNFEKKKKSAKYAKIISRENEQKLA